MAWPGAAEAPQDGAANLGGDLLDRRGGVDHGEALGLLGGEQQEALLNQPVEAQVLGLDPVGGPLLAPVARPREALGRVLGGWVAEGAWSLQDAQRVALMLASGNAERVYGLR